MICQKSANKTDYWCCKNVADKPISNVLPINGASLDKTQLVLFKYTI